MLSRVAFTGLIAAPLCLVVVTLAAPEATLVSLDRERALQGFQSAINDAEESYRYGRTVSYQNRLANEAVAEGEEQLAWLRVRQRTVREEIIALQATIAKIEAELWQPIVDASQSRRLLRAELRQLQERLHADYVHRLTDADSFADVRRVWTLALSSDEYLQNSRAQQLIQKLQLRRVALLQRAVETHDRLAALTEEREQVLASRLEWEQKTSAAIASAEANEELQAEAQRIMADVHKQVLSLQKELASIDERLQRSAARKLIKTGLIDREDAQIGSAITDGFHWPVFGIVTAEYQDRSYRNYFGVPHQGMDIRAGQGSPVAAAADGIVFLARDGGQWGYSYILIGHRDGFATLYGHISEIRVINGQEVKQGDIIGLSGGQPGTHGAGPLTTGPHLHVEVIKDGVHINPREVFGW